MAFLSVNLKKCDPATTVNDNTVIFGAAGGMADPVPEPFSIATLWAHLSTKLTGLFDPPGTAATLAAGALSDANAHTDAEIAAEALARANGDAAAVTAAAQYTDTAIDAAAAGTVPVRYDATQPPVDCLWIAPDGRVVLITGSI